MNFKIFCRQVSYVLKLEGFDNKLHNRKAVLKIGYFVPLILRV